MWSSCLRQGQQTALSCSRRRASRTLQRTSPTRRVKTDAVQMRKNASRLVASNVEASPVSRVCNSRQGLADGRAANAAERGCGTGEVWRVEVPLQHFERPWLVEPIESTTTGMEDFGVLEVRRAQPSSGTQAWELTTSTPGAAWSCVTVCCME